jgi:hypothetical protein
MIRMLHKKSLCWLCLVAFWLSACRGALPDPTRRVPDGWSQVETTEFTLWLPVSWEVHEINAENVSSEFEAIGKVNPQLARNLGGPHGLQEISLWAFDTEGEASNLRDNMNVSRTPLNGEKIEDLQPILDELTQEYNRVGAEVTDSQKYQLEGHPALKVAYHFSTISSGNRKITFEGRQYFFVSGDNMWILSFTLDPTHLDNVVAVVERCAESFHALR